ncbi:hypothetical protein KR215_009823 [Drosophila sulfurigaster]|nr:hypothetical protein KR215_009823 [Drosophila sulfurigaster]
MSVLFAAFWIFLGLLALHQVACRFVDEDQIVSPPCVSQTDTWGSPALNEFHLCANNVTYTITCSPNFYYVSNSTVAGCIPAALMDPQCIDVHLQPPACTANNLWRMLRSNTLTGFYVCQSVDVKPELYPCPDGKKFAENDEYSGCFDWEMWRKVSGCKTYTL